MSGILRALLFLSSDFPAFMILAILYWERRWIVVGALGLGVLGLVGLAVMLRSLGALNFVPVTVAECRRNDSEAMTYVLSYLVPFVAGILEGREAAIAYGVFFVVIGVLYANSDMVHVNPMLSLAGYRIYEAKLVSKDTFILITRRRITAGQSIQVIAVGDEIYLEAKP